MLYLALGRPLIECCTQFLAPHYRKDMDMPNRVQGRAPRMFKGLEHLCCRKRLRKLGQLNLEKMREDKTPMEFYTVCEYLNRTYKQSQPVTGQS